MTKEQATAQLNLEALVYARAKEGQCWRIGGCFRNSNFDSYMNCQMKPKNIAECFKGNGSEWCPGYRAMSFARKYGLCDYEGLKSALEGE